MFGVSGCPSDQELRSLKRGLVPEGEGERLEKHLLSCQSCIARFKDMAVEDALVAEIRACSNTCSDREDESRVDSLIARLKRLPRSSVGAGGTRNATVRDEMIGIPAIEDIDFLAPAANSAEIGRLGTYRVLRVLGRGGMGIVFEAEDTQLERRVALKVMRPCLTADSAARRRFLQEAKAAASIEHPHVVPIFQVGEDRGVPFLAMALLKGESLEDRLKGEASLPVMEVCQIGREIAEGLAAAHDRGLIHRDIKPANVWLETLAPGPAGGEPGCQVRILDFGLAHIRERASGLTRAGAILGSPSYMAPEQADGQNVDARSDLFSLGCVLYRCATGQLPFQGADPISTIWAVMNKNPRPPHAANAAVPRGLSDLIMLLLAKRPEDRPSTAREVAVRLATINTGPAPTAVTYAAATDRQNPIRRSVLVAVVGIAVLVPLAYLFGTPLARLCTNQGELLIETDDPKDEIEVAIRQNAVLVHDRTAQRRFLLTAGQGEVEVFEKASGLKLTTRRFTVTRGGKEIITVQLIRSPDRRVAQRALELGGTIVVNKGNASRTVSSALDLPAGDIELRALDLSQVGTIDDASLAEVGQLVNLRELTLDNTRVTDLGLEHLKGLRSLNRLSLSKTQVTDAGLSNLKNLPNLRLLWLEFTAIGDQGLATLQGNRSLENISLGGTKVTGRGIATLATLPMLRGVYLGYTTVGDDDLDELSRCLSLNDLGLAHTPVTNAGLVHLSALAGRLQQLNLSETGITDDGLQSLSALTKLRQLNLTNTKTTARGVGSLRKALPDCQVRASHLSD